MNKELLLHPIVQAKLIELRELCRKEGIVFRVTQTLRSKAEQDALYAKGRTKLGSIVTNAKYPYSFHNHGVAFDFVPIKDGKADWKDLDKFKRIGELGKSVGLEWGGDWKSFPDRPHLQYTQGKTIQEFVNGYKLKEERSEAELKAIEEAQKAYDYKKKIAEDAVNELEKAQAALALLKGKPMQKFTIIAQ